MMLTLSSLAITGTQNQIVYKYRCTAYITSPCCCHAHAGKETTGQGQKAEAGRQQHIKQVSTDEQCCNAIHVGLWLTVGIAD